MSLRNHANFYVLSKLILIQSRGKSSLQFVPHPVLSSVRGESDFKTCVMPQLVSCTHVGCCNLFQTVVVDTALEIIDAIAFADLFNPYEIEGSPQVNYRVKGVCHNIQPS